MGKDELVLLGRVVARRRVEKHLTQTEVGRRAGLHASHVSRIERGLRNPRLSTLISLADALETTLGELLSDGELAANGGTDGSWLLGWCACANGVSVVNPRAKKEP
jgi:transcriptional regulator with XRE-family HTH domain